MSTSKNLQEKIEFLGRFNALLPEEIYDLCCAALEETYLIRTGPYVPVDMEEKISPGYAQACNEQHNKICEVKRVLKEALEQ